MINNNFDIPFNQNQFGQFLRNQKSSPFQSKLINVANQGNVFGGYCFGLSNIYLQSKLKNEERKFINAFKDIRYNIFDTSHFKKNVEKNKAKTHDKELIIKNAIEKSYFEKLSTEVINTQTFNIKYVFINDLKKSIYSITASNNTHKEIKFKDHLNTLVDELINIAKNDSLYSHDEKKMNIKTLHDIHITAMELYRYAIPPKNHRGFFRFLHRKNINKLEIKDNNFNEAVKKIKDSCNIQNGKFTNQDIGKVLIQACAYYNNSSYKNWLAQNIIFQDKYNKNVIKHQHEISELFFYRTDLSDFIAKLTIPKEHYYFFISQNHACAVSKKKQKNGKYEYSFFDPNKGIKYFDNLINFKTFIYSFVKENENYYRFLKNEKGNDYSIRFLNPESQ